MITLPSGAANASGDATTTTDRSIRGEILAIHLVYETGSDAGTDVQIDLLGEGQATAANQTILDKDDNATSAWYYPRNYAETYQGADLTFNGTQKIPIPFISYGRIKITVAQQTEGLSVTAYVFAMEKN